MSITSSAEGEMSGMNGQEVRLLQPRLTEQGREKYLERARDTCGPVQLQAKVRAVGEAYKHGDWKMLSGALADLAAVAVAWEKQVRAERAAGYRP